MDLSSLELYQSTPMSALIGKMLGFRSVNSYALETDLQSPVLQAFAQTDCDLRIFLRHFASGTPLVQPRTFLEYCRAESCPQNSIGQCPAARQSAAARTVPSRPLRTHPALARPTPRTVLVSKKQHVNSLAGFVESAERSPFWAPVSSPWGR